MIEIAAFALLLLSAIIIATYKQQAFILLALVLMSSMFPVVVVNFDRVANMVPHSGLAGQAPRLYGAAVIAVIALLMTRRFASASRITWLGILIVAAIVVMTLTVWDGTAKQWAGVVNLAVSALFWLVGARLSRVLLADRSSEKSVVLLVSGLLVFEFVICVLQAAGLGFSVEASDQGLLRARGTFWHAGDLGKIVVLLMALVLPSTSSDDRKTRRTAYFGIGIAIVVLGLTLSRANLIAGLVMLLTWAVLTSVGKYRSKSLWMLVLAGLAVAPFIGAILLRFERDPDGGSRPELTAAALVQIGRSPWFGSGPNSYVDVVGRFDSATSGGLPVHNAFLLLVAEFGFVLALPFAIGLASIVYKAWKVRRTSGTGERLAATALLALVPAVVLIGATGWGLLKESVLPFAVLIVSLLFHRARGAANGVTWTVVPSGAAQLVAPPELGRGLAGATDGSHDDKKRGDRSVGGDGGLPQAKTDSHARTDELRR